MDRAEGEPDTQLGSGRGGGWCPLASELPLRAESPKGQTYDSGKTTQPPAETDGLMNLSD